MSPRYGDGKVGCVVGMQMGGGGGSVMDGEKGCGWGSRGGGEHLNMTYVLL